MATGFVQRFKGKFTAAQGTVIDFREPVQVGLTAHAGGGQANATQLINGYNQVSTTVTAGDSVKLPPSAPGMSVDVRNAGAAAMQVFGSGTDTINGVAFGTGISQAAGTTALYICQTAGAWVQG